jgi:hypothetical protein
VIASEVAVEYFFVLQAGLQPDSGDKVGNIVGLKAGKPSRH